MGDREEFAERYQKLQADLVGSLWVSPKRPVIYRVLHLTVNQDSTHQALDMAIMVCYQDSTNSKAIIWSRESGEFTTHLVRQ